MAEKAKHQSETEFVLADEPVTLPTTASGTAVKNAARRFEKGYELPAGAAFAFGAAAVDPAFERGKVPPQDSIANLTLIRTPSGQLLACHPARLWSALVSGDGSNGRSRYAIQTSGNGSARPWPIARHHRPAIVDYHTSSLEDMAAAVRSSADRIRSPELITDISRHDRGVWNPPVVVISRAFVRDGDGAAKGHWFLHSIEGSTRMEACHELTEVDPGDPLLRSDEPLEHLRQTRERLVEHFDALPTSPSSLAAARAATIPALVVVAVVDEEGTPISSGFPDVVNSYVESVHVQPRPFPDVAMSNVLGERLLLTLGREGRMDAETVDALMARDPVPHGKPSVRAATLVKTVCDPANETFVRDVAITEERGRLTKNRRAKLIGPLVVRQFDRPAETADRALMRAFTPDALIENEWDISGVRAANLRKRALARFEAGEDDHPIVLELIARGGPALCAAGLLLSDQGSTVKGLPQLRGHVAKVLEGLIESAGGIHVLADAVAWADGERKSTPRRRAPNGTLKKTRDGEELHYGTKWSKGNMRIRALAFNKGVIPRQKDPGSSDTSSSETPEETFRRIEAEMRSDLGDADTRFRDLIAMTDERGRRLIERLGLQPASSVESFSRKLTAAYARYGDDPLAAIDEDMLPDAEMSVEDEGEDE